MKLWWLPMLALAGGCDTNDDVVGPFTGEVHRFVVDDIRVPLTSSEANALGVDLNDDRSSDNALGAAISALATVDNITTHAADMIRSGAIASSIEIQADDLQNDESVAVRYLGADGAEARVVGGRLRDGAFHPNRLATTDHPGQALLRLPVFKDADPAEVSLLAFEIELAPDAGGAYLATLRGVIGPADALAAVQQGILEMMAADPADHRSLVSIIDGPENGNNDGVITPDEIESSGLIRSMLDPDVTLRSVDGALLSIGFQLHLKPCAEGRCVDAPPISPCHDRIRDGDETDVDCGGSCPLACAGARACLAPDDCQSGMCGGGGMCAAPSCTDGRTNWLETDVDCGGSCPRCDLGRRCLSNQDCESLRCGPAGTCLAW